MGDNEPDAVRVSTTADGITTITLNREHCKNAVNPATAAKLVAAFAAFEQDAHQKVCVFHGANGTFCAGFDLHELAKSGSGAMDKIKYTEYVTDADKHRQGQNCAPMGPSRMQLSKPVISAVSGYAVAGGLELSLLGDMRIAEEDAIFGVFCRRWGVPLIDGGTVRLQAIVGLGRAMDMILTGRPVAAQEALQFGLVNRVVSKGKALEEATNLAKQLLTFPQACMNVDRAACYYAAYNAASFEDAMSNEFSNGIKVNTEEGASRFSGGAGRHGGFGSTKL